MDLVIVCGHYGSGKTNLSLNLALSGEKSGTVLIDMDIVNPYFRSGEYENILRENGIDVISPLALGTTVDAPFLSPKIKSAFNGKYKRVIIDLGGDDAGATSLGVYSDEIKKFDYKMIYVINKYREQINTPEKALTVLREIESASRLKATEIINNSHLCNLTSAETILDSVEYAEKTSELCNLPLIFHTVTENIDLSSLSGLKTMPVKRYILPPWEQQ